MAATPMPHTATQHESSCAEDGPAGWSGAPPSCKQMMGSPDGAGWKGTAADSSAFKSKA
jgi:hypothetical protein